EVLLHGHVPDRPHDPVRAVPPHSAPDEIVVPGRRVRQGDRRHHRQKEPRPRVHAAEAPPLEPRQREDGGEDEDAVEGEIGHRGDPAGAGPRAEGGGGTTRSSTLAEQSTPGTPPPGWVPAPTK